MHCYVFYKHEVFRFTTFQAVIVFGSLQNTENQFEETLQQINRLCFVLLVCLMTY